MNITWHVETTDMQSWRILTKPRLTCKHAK